MGPQMKMTRGRRNVLWIERFCLVPHGVERGQHVRLSKMQRDTILEIYDGTFRPGGSLPEVSGPLAAFLCLLHIAGPEAVKKEFQSDVHPDLFTVWGATGPALKAVLKHEGNSIVCCELGTRYAA